MDQVESSEDIVQSLELACKQYAKREKEFLDREKKSAMEIASLEAIVQSQREDMEGMKRELSKIMEEVQKEQEKAKETRLELKSKTECLERKDMEINKILRDSVEAEEVLLRRTIKDIKSKYQSPSSQTSGKGVGLEDLAKENENVENIATLLLKEETYLKNHEESMQEMNRILLRLTTRCESMLHVAQSFEAERNLAVQRYNRIAVAGFPEKSQVNSLMDFLRTSIEEALNAKLELEQELQASKHENELLRKKLAISKESYDEKLKIKDGLIETLREALNNIRNSQNRRISEMSPLFVSGGREAELRRRIVSLTEIIKKQAPVTQNPLPYPIQEVSTVPASHD